MSKIPRRPQGNKRPAKISGVITGFHSVAGLFPLMDEKTFKELRADIEVHGQLTPIWTHEGEIVDGRNRYRACMELGIAPQFQEWRPQQGSLVDFVLGLNMKRRHLTTTQRAVIAFRLLPLLEEDARKRRVRKSIGAVPEILPEQHGDSRDQAAASVGVSGRYVSEVKRIAVDAPEKLRELEAGTLTLQGARRQLSKGSKPRKAMDCPGEEACPGEDSGVMELVVEAISRLSNVRENDPQFLDAMLRVQTYVGNRIRKVTAKREKGQETDTAQTEGP